MLAAEERVGVAMELAIGGGGCVVRAATEMFSIERDMASAVTVARAATARSGIVWKKDRTNERKTCEHRQTCRQYKHNHTHIHTYIQTHTHACAKHVHTRI